jgi:hypothetical protein
MSPGRALPLRHCSCGLMRQTKSLPPVPVPFADGSLQVVANPCWEMALPDVISEFLVQVLGPHTPRCPPGALARFFPGDSGFTSGGTRFAHHMAPAMQLQPGSRFRGYSHSLNVQAPALAQPPGCTHRKTELRSRAARPYTPRRTRLVTCPEQWHHYVPVFGQLVRLDFHQLKFSLVGCSSTIRLLR